MEHNQSNFGLDQCHDRGVRRKQVANPTTNYGFVLPTPTDLVTDLPADFDVALQGVDTRLKALQPGTTLGDLAYSSATANTNTRLAIGSTGDILTVTGGVPVWAPPAGGGKVLQVIQGTTASNQVDNSTSTDADTGVTATITPSSATSKILCLVTIGGALKNVANSGNYIVFKLKRGATTVFTQDGFLYNPVAQSFATTFAMTYLDSPATTSATTYKVTFNNPNNTAFVSVGAFASERNIQLLEIGA
jgi:hypothetical protein